MHIPSYLCFSRKENMSNATHCHVDGASRGMVRLSGIRIDYHFVPRGRGQKKSVNVVSLTSFICFVSLISLLEILSPTYNTIFGNTFIFEKEIATLLLNNTAEKYLFYM